jgi:hypothetical protein
VKKRTGWDRGLKVEASGKGLVGHAGAVLLHHAALLGDGASDSTLWRALG